MWLENDVLVIFALENALKLNAALSLVTVELGVAALVCCGLEIPLPNPLKPEQPHSEPLF